MALNRGESIHERYTADGRLQEAMVDDLRQAYERLAQQQLDDLDRVIAAEKRHLNQLERLENEEKKAARERDRAWDKSIRDGERLTATLQKIEAQTREASRAMNLLSEAGSSFSMVAAKWGSITTGLQSMISLGQQGFNAVDSLATQSLKAQNAARNLQVDIRGAREAFKGYVDDIELARIANMAFEFGVVSTGDELAMLAAGVQAKAEKLGQDTTFLFESAALGIGRESRLILDNLGIILDQEKAYKIVAAAAEKTVDELTALEKAEAFQKAALIEISRAAADAGVSVEGFAASWGKAKVSFENFKASMIGFDDRMGRVNEALRELTNADLEALRFGEVLDRNGSIENIKMFDELTGKLDRWNLSLVDLRFGADELGKSYQQMLKDAIAANDADEADRKLKAIQAENNAVAEQKKLEADEADHMAAVLQAQGVEQEIINLDLERAIELRKEAAELAGDEAEALKQTRLLELFRLKAEQPRRRGGGGRGPTAADRVRVEGEGRIAELEHEVDLLELVAKTDEEIAQVEHRRRLVALERLDLDEKVLAVTKAKNDVERQQQANERAAIDMERELIHAEEIAAAREEEAKWLQEGLDYQRAKIQADADEANRVISLDKYRQESESRRAREARDLEAANERLWFFQSSEIQQIDTSMAAANTAHIEKLAAIDQETAATLAEIDVKRQLLALEDPQTEAERIAWRNEARQLDHDEEMARLNEEDARKQAFAEHDRIRAENEIKRRKAVYANAVRLTESGNSLLQKGADVASLIMSETIKNEDQRAKAELRARGIAAMGVGALETVKAVAAYADLNIPQGILHTAAAGMAFAQGAIMLSGRVPGEHGGGATAAANSGGGGGRERNTSAAPTVPDSVPAADRGPRQLGGPGPQTQQGGFTLIIQGDVNGNLDDETAEKWAIKMRDVGNYNAAAGF